MKQKYRDINLREPSLKIIAFINALIDNYMAQGFKLSVRQLYYQLVARALIENSERSYKRIASIINDGRLAGLIDWEAIEDRNRDVVLKTRWDSGSHIIKACVDSFHMDMWIGQRARMFVIVEKAALAGVLEGVCRKWDVPLLAARGYPSVSIVRELVMQHMVDHIEYQWPVILHLGDHDPSGIDMTRDLRERIEMFAQEYVDIGGYKPCVERIALTMEQIEEKNPPPNPAKQTDARFVDYQRKFGDESWELDALEPAYLVNLVEDQIQMNVDDGIWDERKEEVEDIRSKLRQTYRQYQKDEQ